MKNIFYILFIGLFFSCTEEIKLDLKNNNPLLSIDASINWVKGNKDKGARQQIKITKSTNYYDANVPDVQGAKVVVKDEVGNIFNFSDTGANGIYQCNNFQPVIGRKYFLEINYNNELFKAESTLLETPNPLKISQKKNGGIFGNELEIKTFFQDDASQENYYLFRYYDKSPNEPSYQIIEDEFFNGNEMYGIYSSAEEKDDDGNITRKKLEKGDVLNIQLYQIHKSYYDYFGKIIGQRGGNPFSSVPTNAVGNITNTTNPENTPYGYFRLSQVAVVNYTIQ